MNCAAAAGLTNSHPAKPCSFFNKALQAVLDGFRSYAYVRSGKNCDIFMTVTGDTKVITLRHIKQMKSGVILANAGHFDVEMIWFR